MRFTGAAKRGRPGTSVVEATIVSLVFFVLVFGNSIAQAEPAIAFPLGILWFLSAWMWVAAFAVVVFDLEWLEHPATSTTWFKVAHWMTLGFDAIEAMLAQSQWIDGDNDVEHRVRVTVSSTYQPMFAFVFGGRDIPLSASSTMPIAH